MIIYNNDLTVFKLKELLRYNPETGLFKWIIETSWVSIGEVADCKRKDGYAQIHIEGKRKLSHRLAFLYMTNRWPEEEIDHINGIRDDNRWVNLREADRYDNTRNAIVKANSFIGAKGVFKAGKKWGARIRINCAETYLGVFDTIEEANEAYSKAAKEHYGEFAKSQWCQEENKGNDGMKRSYLIEFYKVGFGGSVCIYGKVWTAWPWCRWVKVWHYSGNF